MPPPKFKPVGAYDAVRAMMDTLMGADRDIPEEHKASVRRRAFDDPEVDRFHLCGCSPYVVLVQTKTESMLPPVDPALVQDERLKEEWEALSHADKDRYGFEHETMVFLADLVDEMDRRIASNNSRLDASEPSAPEVPAETVALVQELKDQITELLVKAEVAGEAGEIDQSVAFNAEAEALQARATEIEAQADAKKLLASTRRQCVCPVSGLIYAANDSDARKLELQAGRQYRAWKAIRDRLAELRDAQPPRGDPQFSRRLGFSRVERERNGVGRDYEDSRGYAGTPRDRDGPGGPRDRERGYGGYGGYGGGADRSGGGYRPRGYDDRRDYDRRDNDRRDYDRRDYDRRDYDRGRGGSDYSGRDHHARDGRDGRGGHNDRRDRSHDRDRDRRE
jgi:hypothetical protein